MHRSRAYLALLLASALVFGFAAPSYAATRAELEQHRSAADSARKRAAEAEALANRLAGEVEVLDRKIAELQSQADALAPQIRTATTRTQRLQAEVTSLTAQVKVTETELQQTEAAYKQQQALLASRVQSTYKQGSWFYFDLLLGSQDISDLITRTELVSRVIESNNNIAADLDRTADSLTRAKVQLDRSLDAVDVKRREARAVENHLRGLQATRVRAANEQEAVQGEKADLMSDSRKNAARLRALAEQEEAESNKIAAELAGSGSGQFAGTMTWPVPASHRVTSPFGPRICPFHGRELHPGIDIGRAEAGGATLQGAEIVAAGSGTVIFAGYRGGYGNTIMIDHGNGVVTLYAHQASGGLRVSTGARVTQGQRIGTVGSTGNSTGPHLHFEVRVNGAPRDPMSYR